MRFREIREARGYSQKYVAITLGVKPPNISRWESGATYPTIENLMKMADLYGVSIDDLLGRSMETETSAETLIRIYRRLNKEGREELLKRAEEMAALVQYTQEKAAEA